MHTYPESNSDHKQIAEEEQHRNAVITCEFSPKKCMYQLHYLVLRDFLSQFLLDLEQKMDFSSTSLGIVLPCH